MAAAALDRHVKIWVVDGKDEAADWAALEPLCAGYRAGVDDELPADVESILRDVLAHAQSERTRAANAGIARDGVPGRAEPGAVLLIDEWAAIRGRAARVGGNRLRDRLDGLLDDILATSRSGGVHAALVTQQPFSDSFPNKQKGNIVERVALPMTRRLDYEHVLGAQPINELPTRKGQALIVHNQLPETSVSIHDIPDEAWMDINARAWRLRGIEATPAPAGPQEAPESAETLRGSDPAPPAPGLPRDPTLSGVVDVLGDGDPAGMSSETIMYTLPEHLRVHPRPPDIAATGDEAVAARRNAANAMGKALGKWSRADDPLIRSKKTPGPRLWQLTAPAMAPGGSRQDVPAPAIAASDVPWTCHPPATDPDNGASDPPLAANGGKIGPQTPEIGPPGAHVPLPPSRHPRRHRRPAIDPPDADRR